MKVKLLLTLLLLAGSTPLLAQGTARQDSVYLSTLYSSEELAAIKQLTEKAEDLFGRGRYTEAVKIAEDAITGIRSSFPNMLRVRNYLLLARAMHHQNQIGSSLKYYLKSIKELEKLEEPITLARIYIETGNLYKEWDFPKRTLDYYLKGTTLFRTVQDTASLVRCLPKNAAIFKKIDMRDMALKTEQELLKIYRARKDQPAVLKILMQAAATASKIGKHDLAMKYLYEAIEISKKTNDIRSLALATRGNGEAYRELADYQQALKYFIEYLIISQEVKMDSSFRNDYEETLYTMGLMYQELGDAGMPHGYKHAINYFYRKLEIAREKNDFEGIARIYSRIGMMYYKLRNYNEAITYASKAVETGKMANATEVVRDSYLQLSKSYEKRRQRRKALYYQQLHTDVQELVFEQEIKHQKVLRIEQAAENRRQFIINKTEQMIIDEEIDTLAYRQLELETEKQQQELELLMAERELQEFTLRNEQLKAEKAQQELMLIQQQFEAEKREKQITLLQKDHEIQELALKQKTLEEQEKQQAIELLEKSRALQSAELKQKEARFEYFLYILVLVLLILCLLLVGFLLTRRANRKLSQQKEQIEEQACSLQKAYDNLELLSQIGQDITANLSVSKIINIVYSNVNSLMDAAVFGIGIYNKATGQLEFPGVKENGEDLGHLFFDPATERTLATLCFNQRQEIFISDFEQEWQHYLNQYPEKPHAGSRHAASLIYVPILLKNEVKGVITVQSFQRQAFNPYHLNLVRNIAVYTKIALENASAYQQIRSQSERLAQANNNISEQKNLIEIKNEELVVLNEEKNHLISILAHDLRNPLAIAISLTDFVKMHPENLREEQVEGLNITHRSLNRMNNMIAKILDVRAIESKKINITTDAVQLQTLVAQAVENFEPNASAKNITLELEAGTQEICPAEVDRNYTLQVIENLVSNAIKFSPAKSTIKVVIQELPECVQVQVTDQGPGIPGHDFEKLFKKYQKLTAKPTAGESSTGLGLSIVKKFTEAMNGRVWCESRQGEGATFVLQFQKAGVLVS